MARSSTRREFLKTAGSAAAGAALALTAGRAADARERRDDRVLVLVHLKGGNDGFNTIVPLGEPAYYRLRPALALDEDRLIPLTDSLAFNDRLVGLARLYEEGRVAIVLGAGYPNPDRSHFRAVGIWRAGGEPDARNRAGWLADVEGPGQSKRDSKSSASLPEVARLIREDSPRRVHRVTFPGFDTHAKQRARHDRLLHHVGQSIARFQSTLRRGGTSHRVLTMVYSEFGRRLEENASGGTDHGTAGPLFLIGDGVNGGLHGRLPRLRGAAHGDLEHTTDFRTVYAAVLRDWFGVTPPGSIRDASLSLPPLAQDGTRRQEASRAPRYFRTSSSFT